MGPAVKSQKLFADYPVPELHLKAFPYHYIYENIVKPLNLKQKSTEIIDEATFKKIVSPLITAHIDNSASTVRSLQQQVLKRLVTPPLNATVCEAPPSRIQATVITPSLQEPYRQLKTFVDIQCYKTKHKIQLGNGLNGLVIKGEPGTGKSKLVQAFLAEHAKNSWIKIDANQSFDSIRQSVSAAMKKGQLVLLEELDSVVYGKLEKDLNLALTGIDPCTGKPPIIEQPSVGIGFALIATINGAHMDGRHCFSRALQARCQTINMPATTQQDTKAILIDYGYKETAVEHQALMQLWKDKQPNLRDFCQLLSAKNEGINVTSTADILKPSSHSMFSKTTALPAAQLPTIRFSYT